MISNPRHGRLRDSWRTSLPVAQQPRNPQSESIARNRYHIGQFRGRTRAEVEGGEALRLTRAVAGADEQPPDPDRHVAEQGAERRTVVAFAGQRTSTGDAPATMRAHGGHLRRDHLGLERRRELLRLVEPQPEAGEASLLAALETRDLCLRGHAGLRPAEHRETIAHGVLQRAALTV